METFEMRERKQKRPGLRRTTK